MKASLRPQPSAPPLRPTPDGPVAASAPGGAPPGRGQPAAARWLLGVALLALGWYAIGFVRHALAVVQLPYQIDYGEGPLLAQARLLAHGFDLRALYHDDARPPYTVANYPPLFPAVVGLLQRVLGHAGLGVGRAVSATATLATAVLCGLTARAALAEQRVRGAAVAALGAGLFLCQRYVWLWGVLHRVDALALALTLAGLYAVARRPERADRAWPWFVLAALTRQSAVGGLAAALWLVWPTDHAVALRLLRRWGLALACAVAALEVATRGQFLVQIVLYNLNRWQAHTALAALAGWLLGSGGLPLLALALWGWGLWAGHPGARLVRGFALAAWGISLTVGKVGSAVNYFLPAIAACALLAAPLALLSVRRLAAGGALALYALGIPPLAAAPGRAGVAVRALFAYHDPVVPGYGRLGAPGGAPAAERAQAALQRVFRRTPGPILAEDMGALVLSGHRIYFQPFELTQVARNGRFDLAPLVARAAAGGFPLVQLNFPLGDPAGWDTARWPPALLRALAARYRPAGVIGRFHLYRPRRATGHP